MNLHTMTEADFDAVHNSHFAGRAGQGPLRVVALGDQYRPEPLYAPLRDFVSPGTPACTANACSQGRKACPSPDACRIPDDDAIGRDPRFPEGAGFLVSLGLVAGIVCCVLALSYLVRAFP